MRPTNPPVDRRTFLKASTAVGIGSLAGCIGGSGGDELIIGMPPLGPSMLTLDRIDEQTDILQQEMDEVGYDYDFQITWEEIPLYAGGQVDMVPSLSDIEGSRIAAEREVETAFHGMFATNYEGLYVRKGSDWDPEVSGGIEETLQLLVDGEGIYGNAGWEQGSVIPAQLIFKSNYDIDYGPEASDFDVQSADWPALPKLLMDRELDVIENAPPLGPDSAEELAGDEEITDILWYQPYLEEIGLDARTANLGMFGTRQEYSDNNEEAIAAFMRAWQEGAQWISNPDNFDEILDNEENIDTLNAENREQAEIILEFSQDPPSHTSVEGNPEPVIMDEVEISDDFVDTEMEALSMAEELGSVPEGWDEYVEFRPISL